MKLKVIRDWDSEKTWMSPWINHGDWPFVFMLRLQYTEEWGDDAVKQFGRYYVDILAVSPIAAGDENLKRAYECVGYDEDPDNPPTSEMQAEMLLDYGVYAPLASCHGNNLQTVLKTARAKLKETDFLFGFAMDRQANAIGNTGWDFIRGDIGFKVKENA